MVCFSRENFHPFIVFTLFAIFLGVIVGPSFFSALTVQAGTSRPSVSVVVTVCGNGILELGEVCDSGANNGNYSYCKADCSGLGPRCGDGLVQAVNGEQCDDSNTVSGDGCSASCQSEAVPPPSPRCGDGTCNSTESCSSCPADCGGCGGGGGGGGGGGELPTPSTKVILQGKAYPLAKITILKDGSVSTVSTADSQANFKVELTNITAGTYTFGVWAEDKKARKSITFSFTTSVAKGMTTTIGGIFIPPTIELEKPGVQKGETLNILGQTAPQSEVSLSIYSSEIIKEALADKEGDWAYYLQTVLLDEGSHTVRAKAETPDGLLSSYSKVLSFYIGKEILGLLCSRADLNGDGKTNLVDFSILLYWWGKANPCADQNKNNKVDLADFSIMLYYWTG